MTAETRSRFAIVAVMLVAGGAGLVWSRGGAVEPSASIERPASPPAPAPPSSELDERIAAQARFAETSRSWVDWDVVAAMLMDRAESGSGGLEDLGRASEALDRAFAMADRGAGPHLRRAILASRLHRLDECEAMLDVVEGYALLTPDDRETARSLRTHLAFFRGDYAAARRGYEAALAERADATSLFSLARLDWSTGNVERAAERLDQADAVAPDEPEMGGFLALARANLLRERGDLEGTVRAAQRALLLRPADGELRLFLAEVRLDQGELTAADALVTAALETFDGPRAHEVAARVARARGDLVAMEEHRAAATRAYDALFARFPEAIAGHATLHFLRFEDEARTVAMAEVDATARPFGEARSRLALAYLRAGRLEEARREIEAVLASEWRTAELHAIAAEIFASSGDSRAEGQRALAEARAPGVTARIAELRAP